MNSAIQLEQQLIEAVRILSPEKQQAVLDFAEFLKKRQSLAIETQSDTGISAPKLESKTTRQIYLAERGITSEQAADLRARLQTFAEDWDRPAMAVYDYDYAQPSAIPTHFLVADA